MGKNVSRQVTALAVRHLSRAEPSVPALPALPALLRVRACVRAYVRVCVRVRAGGRV